MAVNDDGKVKMIVEWFKSFTRHTVDNTTFEQRAEMQKKLDDEFSQTLITIRRKRVSN